MVVKNIIVVNDYDYIQGGASLVAIETANLLYEKGYNVTFFCGVSKGGFLHDNINVVTCNDVDFLNSPNKLKGIVRGIYDVTSYRLMKETLNKFDKSDTVVLIHGWTKALSPSFIKACYKKSFKTILTGHDYFSICPNGGLFNYKKKMICNKNGKIKCLFCNCDSRNFAFKIYRNIRFFVQDSILSFAKKIDCLITISSLSETLLINKFNKSIIKRIYNPTSINNKNCCINVIDNTYFLYVGRISKEKGVDLLIESFRKLQNEKLIIVGDGDELDNYKQIASKNVDFVGWKNHDEVINFMRNAKALIFPSIWYEGAPLTIFEALSQGLPCIVSKKCSAIDFVDEDNGYIYDPYQIDELVNIINKLNKNELSKKSVISFDRFWDNPPTKDKYIIELEKLFLEL